MSLCDSYILINLEEAILSCRLSYFIKEEDGWYFAECPELDLIDQGQSVKEAVENLRNMILATLIEAYEAGEITEMLKALDFTESESTMPELQIYARTDGEYINYHPLLVRTGLLMTR